MLKEFKLIIKLIIFILQLQEFELKVKHFLKFMQKLKLINHH